MQPWRTRGWWLLLAAIAPAGVTSGAAARVRGAVPAGGATLLGARLPVRFEENRGQADPRVRYFARGAGFQLFLTATEAVLGLSGPLRPDGARGRAALRMRLEGADPEAPLTAADLLPGQAHYLDLARPERSRTGIRSFGRVGYRGVYPGIDHWFYSTEAQVEHDLVVAPGADPGRIRLRFEGVVDVRVGGVLSPGVRIEPGTGDLLLRTPQGTLRERRPVVYQEVDGERRRVAGAFAVDTDQRVSFRLGAYDRTRSLVIDPILQYCTYLGGSSDEECSGIAVDGAGNAYITGTTASTDFPTTTPALQSSGTSYVTKLNGNGTGLVYSAYFSGKTTAIAVTEAGEALVTTEAGLVARLSADGASLRYLTDCKTPLQGVAAAPDGSAWVTGYVTNASLMGTDGSQLHGVADVFVAKLSAPGAILFSSIVGGTANDRGRAVAVDPAGDAFVGGGTLSADFPTTSGAYSRTYRGSGDAVVLGFHADGALIYSTYLGGTGKENGMASSTSQATGGIAVDAAGAVYVAAGTNSSDFPTPFGSADTTYNGAGDAYAAKLDPSGSSLVYATYLGSPNTENATAVAVNALGECTVVGLGTGIVPVTPDAAGPFNNGGSSTLTSENSFITTLAPAGDRVFSTSSTGYLQPAGIAMDAAGMAYVCGASVHDPSIMTTTVGAFQEHQLFARDAFVMKLGPGGPQVFPRVTTFVAVATSATTIDLAWVCDSDIDGFDLFQMVNTRPVPLVRLGPDARKYTVTGLTQNTLYRFFVKPFKGTLAGRIRDAYTGTPYAPPAAPSDLRVTLRSSGALRLEWTDASNDETGFRVERKTSTGFVQVGALLANSRFYDDTGLVPNTEYTYRVRAEKKFDGGILFSPYSNEASGRTLPNGTPPAAPSDLTARAASGNRIDLAWKDNSADETSFLIERKTGTGDFSQVAEVGSNLTAFADTQVVGETTYTYRVRASSPGGESPYSNEAAATTPGVPPAAPSGLAVSVPAPPAGRTQLRLEWLDNSTNEAGFQIERKSGSGGFAPVTQVPTNATSFVDTSLTPNTAYTYRVRASGSGVDSAYSDDATAATLPNPPAAPADLVATVPPAPAGATQLVLTWTDASSDETGFEIERMSGAGDFARIATPPAGATGFTDSGLAPATTYTYHIRAVNAGGPSPYSNEASAATLPNPPGTPSDLAVTVPAAPEGSSQLVLDWVDHSSSETGFEVERRTGTADFTRVGATTPDVTHFVDRDLAAGTLYDYRVRAINPGGPSGYSNTASAATRPLPPAAPTDLTAAALPAPEGSTQVQLAWTDASGNEDGFRVERKSGSADFQLLTNLPANSSRYLDRELPPGTSYTYRVRAFNDGGASAYSNVASATTLPSPPGTPSDLAVTVPAAPEGSSQLVLDWADHSPNETGFQVERRSGTGDFAPVATTGPDVTHYVDRDLTPRTVYIYRVRAINPGGPSDYSNTASAATRPLPPAAPADLVATGLPAPEGTTRLTLTWTDRSDNEAEFQVERKSGAGDFQLLATLPADSTQYADRDLEPATRYTYRVRAANDGGASAPSNEASGTTLQPAPASPEELRAEVRSSGLILLTWKDRSTNESAFEMERAVDGGTFTRVAQLPADTTSFADATVDAGHTYAYRARAMNEGGPSAYSNEVRATVPLPVVLQSFSVRPSSVRGGRNATGTVRLSGPAPTGGSVVSLRSSSSLAHVPAQVRVPSGRTETSFSIRTTAVPRTRRVTITASFGGKSKTATLTLTR